MDLLTDLYMLLVAKTTVTNIFYNSVLRQKLLINISKNQI